VCACVVVVAYVCVCVCGGGGGGMYVCVSEVYKGSAQHLRELARVCSDKQRACRMGTQCSAGHGAAPVRVGNSVAFSAASDASSVHVSVAVLRRHRASFDSVPLPIILFYFYTDQKRVRKKQMTMALRDRSRLHCNHARAKKDKWRLEVALYQRK
jgi:hypothetical protein